MLRISAYAPAPQRVASSLGALVVTPGQMLDEMNAVNNAVDELAIRVTQQFTAAGANTAWVNAFTRWRAEWKKFYAEHQGWTDRLFAGTYDKIVEYRAKLAEWRAQFEAMPTPYTSSGRGTSVGPDLSPTPPTDFDQTFEKYKPFVITGGALIGLGLIWAIIRRVVPVRTARSESPS